MHFPNALNERFIDFASSNVCPSLPDIDVRNPNYILSEVCLVCFKFFMLKLVVNF